MTGSQTTLSDLNFANTDWSQTPTFSTCSKKHLFHCDTITICNLKFMMLVLSTQPSQSL